MQLGLLLLSLLMLLNGCASQSSDVNITQVSIQNEYGGHEVMLLKEVEQYSLLFRVAVVVLIIACIYLYHKKEMSYRMEYYFSKTIYTWISLGFLVGSICMMATFDTDTYIRWTIIADVVFLIPYFLCSQYDNADKKEKKLSKKQWLSAILLGIFDFVVIFFMRADLQVLVVLSQTVLAILYDSRNEVY